MELVPQSYSNSGRKLLSERNLRNAGVPANYATSLALAWLFQDSYISKLIDFILANMSLRLWIDEVTPLH